MGKSSYVVRNPLARQAHLAPQPSGTSLNGANQPRRIAAAVVNTVARQPRTIVRHDK